MNVSTDPIFHLYWLRETGCDAGTPFTAGELPASIRDRVVALAQEPVAAAPSVFHVRLPFFDRREERLADELLAAVPIEREGNLIRAMLPPSAATRDIAATCALPIHCGATLRVSVTQPTFRVGKKCLWRCSAGCATASPRSTSAIRLAWKIALSASR